ncbi:YegP family protein [Kitasatospora sp. NBC_00085]|uniref:YegP family protein n=1 Tax=unclassified Kitasatospora TaxID=2633591 RepID=UPI0032480CC3
MAGRFEDSEDAGGKYRFRLKAGNGEIVATGQGYASKEAAHKGVEAVQRAAVGANVVDVPKAATA